MLGGALSGGVMAGGSLAINAYQNSEGFKDKQSGKDLANMKLTPDKYAAMVENGLNAPEGSEVRRTAEAIKVKLDAGKRISQAEYGKLWRLTNAAIDVALGIAPAQNEQNNTASTEETGSTVINTNPAQHTPAEQKVIDEYQAAVDENLVNFVETSMENKGSNKGKYTLKGNKITLHYKEGRKKAEYEGEVFDGYINIFNQKYVYMNFDQIPKNT